MKSIDDDSFYFDISIIIVTWNGLGLLKESLDSVVRASKAYPGKSEIILVDNGSVDRTVDVISDYYPEIKLLALEKNYGFSVGNNLGVKQAQYPYVCFLNNDVRVAVDFLSHLVKPFLLDDKTFSSCPVTYFWDDQNFEKKRVFSTSIDCDISHGDFVQYWAVDDNKSLIKDELQPTIYGTGAALLVNKEKFNRLDGFNEIYSPAYWEDTDLCYHAWKKNWPSYFVSSSEVWHKISASSKNLENSFKRNLIIKNAVVFYLINIDKIVPLMKFMMKVFFFSLEKKHQGDDIWKIIFNLFRHDFFKILKIKIKRIRSNVLSDDEIVNMTRFNNESKWKSPSLFDLTLYKKKLILLFLKFQI